MDIPEVTGRPVVEPGMEVFVADQFGKFIISNCYRDYGMVFLEGWFYLIKLIMQ